MMSRIWGCCCVCCKGAGHGWLVWVELIMTRTGDSPTLEGLHKGMTLSAFVCKVDAWKTRSSLVSHTVSQASVHLAFHL